MKATVNSNIVIPADDSAEWEALLTECNEVFRVNNPKWIQAKIFGKGWNKHERYLYAYGIYRGVLTLPRGAVGELRDVEFVDERSLGQTEELKWIGPELRPYQQEAAAALFDDVQGVVCAPCGSGKTVIGLAAMVRAGRRALVLVHTLDLLEQWRGAVLAYLGIEADVLTEGPAEGPIQLCTMQSASKWKRPDTLQYGVVLVDECHHVPCETLTQLLMTLPAKWRWGLTATPERADKLEQLLYWSIGPIVSRVNQAELVAMGYLVEPEIRYIETGCSPEVIEDSGKAFSTLLKDLIGDEARNMLIVNLVIRENEAGHAVLVLTGRVAHAEMLAHALRERSVMAYALTGKVSKKSRKEYLAAFREGKLDVLVAVNLADEALDLPNLARMVLASPVRAKGKTIQRMGRLMRPGDGKGKPVLYDLIDDHPVAKAQAAARKRAFKEVLG